MCVRACVHDLPCACVQVALATMVTAEDSDSARAAFSRLAAQPDQKELRRGIVLFAHKYLRVADPSRDLGVTCSNVAYRRNLADCMRAVDGR